jgi:hypothetical protein
MNNLLLICVFLLLAACQQKEAETAADNASEQNAAELAEAADEEAGPVVLVTAEDKEIVAKLGSDNCLAEFKEYLTYKENAAFATSTDSACGYSSESLKTVEEARNEAIATCEKYRKDGEACKVVNINGKWES